MFLWGRGPKFVYWALGPIWWCGYLYTGPWALFDDVDTSEEGQMIREALDWRIMYERVEEYSPRRLSFSDRMNIGQAST